MKKVFFSLLASLIFVCASAFSAEKLKHVQYQVSEFSFTAEKEYKNPVMDVAMQAEFKGPGDKTYIVPAFWDGAKSWKVRFTPTVEGDWTFSTSSKPEDTGLDKQTGKFFAGKAEGENPLQKHGGFLRVSADKHYLTYDDGTPFFWLGDTWWFCPSDLMPFEECFKKCIDKRAGQGYSVVQWAFLANIKTSQGVNTFRDFPNTKTLNPEYWQKADQYIRYANSKGIMPVFGLAFHSGMDQTSLEDWKIIWKYALARYSAYSVSFLICGEYNLTDNDVKKDRVQKTLALGQFIKDTDPYKRAMTVHPWWYGGDKRQAWNSPWYDFIIFQGGHGGVPPTKLYTDPYFSKTPKPVLEVECRYEGIFKHDDTSVREVAFRAIQSGSFGFTYGSQGLWYPTQNKDDKTFQDWGAIMVWSESLNRPGGAQMNFLRQCYESVEWWNLKPLLNAVTTERQFPDDKQILVKADGDKTFVVFFPAKNPANLKVKMKGAAKDAKYSAQWFDPRTGATAEAKSLEIKDGFFILPDRPGDKDHLLIIRKITEEAKR